MRQLVRVRHNLHRRCNPDRSYPVSAQELTTLGLDRLHDYVGEPLSLVSCSGRCFG
jgi:hypothetical protein